MSSKDWAFIGYLALLSAAMALLVLACRTDCWVKRDKEKYRPYIALALFLFAFMIFAIGETLGYYATH